jgi:hypothetical protein
MSTMLCCDWWNHQRHRRIRLFSFHVSHSFIVFETRKQTDRSLIHSTGMRLPSTGAQPPIQRLHRMGRKAPPTSSNHKIRIDDSKRLIIKSGCMTTKDFCIKKCHGSRRNAWKMITVTFPQGDQKPETLCQFIQANKSISSLSV